MKTLLTLIEEYKEQPSDELRDFIWAFMMNKDNGHYFANIDACNDEGDWIQYGENLRIKKIKPQYFVATEIVKNTFGGYFCLLHTVKLSDFSEIQIEEYKENYPEYEKVFSDEDFFSAASIASVLSVEDAESSYLAEDDIALEAWVARIEEKYSNKTDIE